MSEVQSTEPNAPKKKASLHIMKTIAINAAMFEILQEQKSELLKRARIKLKDMGYDVSDDEFAKEVQVVPGT